MRKNFLSLCYAVMAALCLGEPSVASAVTTPEAVVCAGANSALIFDITVASPTITTVAVGSIPTGVAITPDGTQAWICNQEDTTVSVINLDTNTLLDTITVGTSPTDVAITPDGTQAWVTNNGDDTVSVINIATRTVTATVPLPSPSGPEGIAITPDGTQAWVCDDAANPSAISVINVATHAVTTFPISLGNVGPFRIAITPNNAEAWITTAGNSNVSVINIASQSVTHNIAVGNFPSGIAITSDGTEAWVSNFTDSSVSVINVATHTVVDTITDPSINGPVAVAITPDDTRVWIANASPNAVAIDRATRTIVNIVGLDSGPDGIAITPDQAPTARFTASINGSVASFDASASSSPYGTIASYKWNFGDGSAEETLSLPQISHTYANGGTFTVTLTVTNTQGTSITQTFTGHTVSNNGGPSAQTSEQITISTNFAPSKFIGKPKIHKHDKKLLMKTKWTKSSSPTVARYKIFAHHKKIASISAHHEREYTLHLHPQDFPCKHLSNKYKHYLKHKYTIRAVNANGAISAARHLHVVQ